MALTRDWRSEVPVPGRHADLRDGWPEWEGLPFVLVLAALLAVFLLDVALHVVLLPFYLFPLVLATSFTTPRQQGAMVAATLALAVLSGLRWSSPGSLDVWLRLAAIALVALVSIILSKLRHRREHQRLWAMHHYQLLAENASDVVFRATCEGVTEWISNAVTKLLGWQPEDLIGQPFRHFVHPEDLALLQQVDDAFRRGERRHFRLRVRHRQGGHRWVGVNARGVRDDVGRVVGILGSWNDIQAEVVAEQETARALSRLAATLDSLLDPHVVLQARRDDSGTIVDFVYTLANAAAGKYNFLNADELIGRSMLELMPAHRSTGLWEKYCHAVVSGEPLVLDDFTYPHDIRGETRSYDIRAVPFGDELSITWRDITERWERFRLLESSEEEFRLLARNSSDVMVRIRDNAFAWVSPSLTAALGWTPEEWISRPIREVVHPEDFAAFMDRVRAINNGESGAVSRLRLRAQDGLWHWVEVHAGPYRDDQDRIDGLVASFRVIDREVVALQRLEHHAHFDELTGLLNRREVLQRIDARQLPMRRAGRQTAVLFCDLDQFKSINDNYGHAAGDHLLRAVAERIRGCLRHEDLAARLGGDELLVVLKGVKDLECAAAVGEKIRRVVEDPVATPFGQLKTSLSIGVTLALPGESSEALMARADGAMYEAKKLGRNRVFPIGASV